MSSNKDPKGYYSCLGVATNASADEIKSCYKSLAKKLHPDISQNPNAKIQFQKINEAYQILSDPDLRSTYDSLQYSKPEPEPKSEQLNPICCSHCGKITAQPRSTIFFRVVSVVLLTTKTPIQGTFCSVCAAKLGLRASIISALFGWWGFPWGPIWTIGAICTNAVGGRHSQDIDEKLTWYNALAFLSRGKLAISYALAQQSRRARNSEIAASAEKLIDHLRAAGVPTASPGLKNPWSNPLLTIAHIMLLILVPGAIGLAVAYDDITKGTTHNYTTQAYSPPVAPTHSPAQQSLPKPDFSSYASTAPTHPLDVAPPSCAHPPYNGKVLTRNFLPATPGHKIEIKNGSSANAIVKVRDGNTGSVRLSFFVEKGNTAIVSNVPDGIYKIQFAFGETFGINCGSFAHISSASQFPELETLMTRETSTQIITGHLSYTLYSVPGGNVRPNSLSLAAFNAD